MPAPTIIKEGSVFKGNIFYLLIDLDDERKVIPLNRDELQHIRECIDEVLED